MSHPHSHICLVAALLGVVLALPGCGSASKVRRLQEQSLSATLRLPREAALPSVAKDLPTHRDTLKIEDPEGREMFVMKAFRDEDGEMVASETLDAAVVTARFRNVAERHGKVDLEFQVIVPEAMQDSRWQLRFYPDMYLLSDSVRLDPVIITGREYRRAQLRGYQQYERFLASIVSDTTKFIHVGQLEIFLRRNIPALYAFKTDSTVVSDEAFASIYGVTEREAVDHYTDKWAVSVNERRKARTGRMYRRFVKVPIVTEGLRLDTVIRAVNGDFVYNYVQTIATRPQLRKADIILSGDIWESDRKVYSVPRSEPLSFYISSLSSFVDPAERYLERILERKVEANTACYVEFSLGSHAVDLGLGHNAEEIGRIRENLRSLLRNETFDLDSIVVTASCSPEGSFRSNEMLSRRRSEGVTRYFRSWMKHYGDSLASERGLRIDLDGTLPSETPSPEIRFISRNNPENWPGLDALVDADPSLTQAQRDTYRRIRGIPDPDDREAALSREPFYRYLREAVYPYLRTVRFDFHLHRKGMVQDTVRTTEPDTLYMRGVQALREHDYETAVTILRPYGDFNAALAFCAMDYNASALSILEQLPRTPRGDYLLAILYARTGRVRDAVQRYLDACHADPAFVHRGNLDPEISQLIRLYGLNGTDDTGSGL